MASIRKSSFHFISGDRPLNQLEEGVYRLSYLFERFIGSIRSTGISCQFYRPTLDAERLVRIFGERASSGSPSRILSFDFILEVAKKEFGPDKSVIDLGCGSGVYAQHLHRAFGYRHYNGYDIAPHPEWPNFAAANVHFATAELGKDWIDVDDADIVFSQSVLEHIQYDCQVFARFRTARARRLRHVHLVPATLSFFEGRLHGYRRYGLRAIANLLSAKGISEVELYALGNWVTREIHWESKGKPKRAEFHDGHVTLVPYDRSLPVVENMARNRANLVAKRVEDAAFFALIFTQDVDAE
ncbi:class I SAM-dependent methyltransferase [Oleomonas cavernae]|uniref:class I SAM-dependent methyltransferase n=1 Tax=Oleomonas cavernae TaxID=2320859 RepID=UPI001314EBF1|nr:class I SAM-dependent methyltransferase [Oleomonas cavernae]